MHVGRGFALLTLLKLKIPFSWKPWFLAVEWPWLADEVLLTWIWKKRGLRGHPDPNSLCLHSQCNHLALELQETLPSTSLSEFPFTGTVKLLIHICKQPRLPWRGSVVWGVAVGGSKAAPWTHVLVMGHGCTLCALPGETVLGSLLRSWISWFPIEWGSLEKKIKNPCAFQWDVFRSLSPGSSQPKGHHRTRQQPNSNWGEGTGGQRKMENLLYNN